MRLKSVVFAENGRGGITIDDKQLGVIDNEEFSFVQPPVDSTAIPRKVSAKPMAQPKPYKPMNWRVPLRLSLGAIAIGGIAAGIYENTQVVKYQKAYDSDKIKSIIDNDKKNASDAQKYRNFGYVIGIAAACGFTLTFFF